MLLENIRSGLTGSLDPSKNLTTKEFRLSITYQRESDKIKEVIRKEPVNAPKLTAAIKPLGHAYDEKDIIDWIPYSRTWW